MTDVEFEDDGISLDDPRWSEVDRLVELVRSCPPEEQIAQMRCPFCGARVELSFSPHHKAAGIWCMAEDIHFQRQFDIPKIPDWGAKYINRGGHWYT